MTKIAVVGSINTDFVVRTGRFPVPGETVVGDSFAIYGGGKGANQAIAAARSGASVEFFGAVGRDVHSSERLAALQADGVSTEHVAVVDGYGGVAVIQVETTTGQNSITLVSGANNQVKASVVKPNLSRFLGQGDILCLQFEIPFETTRVALEVGQRVGAVNVLNAAPFDARAAELLPLVDVLIVNEIEAGQFLGRDPVGSAEVGKAADALRAMGVGEAVVVTLGAQGAWLNDGTIEELISARQVDVVDSTGAGDAFCGAFCAWLSRGASRIAAVRAASIAGSLSVQRHGAQPSLPRRAEVEQLLSGGRSNSPVSD